MPENDYGEGYFLSHCGLPYHRGEPHWLKFFGDVAQRIDDLLAPRTVFDAGCAIGFLVETLRARGIEAFGRDFSSYAIGQIPAGLQPFCEHGSIADPIEGSYDLVTCIEVVEHMSPDDARRAIENMCRVAPRILFSSSPIDFTEATHINVQPPIYWMRLFAKHGFGPRADFDGSFLCPWAILFERRPTTPEVVELETQARLVLARIDLASRPVAEDGGRSTVVDSLSSEINSLQDQVARLEEIGQRLSRFVGSEAGSGDLRERLTAMRVADSRTQLALRLTEKQLAESKLEARELQKRVAALENRKELFRFWRKRKSGKAAADQSSVPQSADEAQVEASGLFDAQWYLSRYPDILVRPEDALRHYFEHGAEEGRDPNPYFSTRWYAASYPEVTASGLNPLSHYVQFGAQAGLRPSEEFDPSWYLRTYPDIAKAELEPLQHYLLHGQAEGRRRNAADRSSNIADAMIETIKAPAPASEIVLFVTHAPEGQIKPHVRPYLESLKQSGLAIILIVAVDPADSVDAAPLLDVVDGLFIRENGGFDFAAWAHVARLVDMSGVRLLCLANDSLLGPFSTGAMQAIMERVRASRAQLVGLTDNYEFNHHLQSYFLVAKEQGVSRLVDFLSTVRWLENKQEVIFAYELQTLDHFKAAGLAGEALFETHVSTNRTTTDWRQLIKDGFPFIKMAVLQSLKVDERRAVMKANGYDPAIAEGSLAIILGNREASKPISGRSEDLAAVNTALSSSLQGALGHWNAAASRVAELEDELSRARNRPWKVLHSKLKFRLYRWLSSWSPPLSQAKAAKYANRARRHDPHRSSTVQRADAPTPPVAMTGLASVYTGRQKHDPDKRNVLVVSHQASRTGAPILALNIGERLATRYNIYFMCLTGGDLIDDFCAVAEKVIDANLHSMDSANYVKLISRLADEAKFEFAIVNSVESHAVLQPLHENNVPTVALLHEFASYTGKKSAFPEAMRWADETVFSTRLTRDNAFDNNLMDFTPTLHVIPQGKCRVPASVTSEASRTAERALLRETLAPELGQRKRFQVLGAGTVEIRKGVDLFIETATRVLNAPGSEHIHFAWFGNGYAPDRDYAYSVYLRDQLQRAGIENRVTLLPATSEIEFVYEMSDVLLLSSRLDPLPNVGIDALCCGMPVLCFSETTGIADLLASAGLERECVAAYIDTSEIADKLLALARSAELYQEVAIKTKAYADEFADLDRYVSRLETLALNAKSRADSKAGDVEEIVRSGTFRADFFDAGAGRSAPASSTIVGDYIERLNWVGAARKPEPGFNPFIYAQAPSSGYDGTSEAYADFLRKGRPAGPWLLPVLEGGEAAAGAGSAAKVKSALHIHAYFTERLPEIAARLSVNLTQPDLFISVGENSSPDRVRDIFRKHRGNVVVRQTPNIGRDIAPFLTVFGPELVDDYEVVGHIHVKKSTQLDSSAFVVAWNEFLLENMLGGTRGGAMLDLILSRFEQDAKIGLVYPDDPHIFGWTRNKRKAERLARLMGHSSLPTAINFPIGTMFWMRAAALRPFLDLRLDWSDYPREPLADDGTDLHALERLFGVIPMLEGWQTLVTNIRDVTR